MGHRVGKNYQFLSYEEVIQQSHALGSAFINILNCKISIICILNLILSKINIIGNSTNIAIYARNCCEWFISDFACLRYSMVVVPVYDTLGSDAATYILTHTEAR